MAQAIESRSEISLIYESTLNCFSRIKVGTHMIFLSDDFRQHEADNTYTVGVTLCLDIVLNTYYI